MLHDQRKLNILRVELGVNLRSQNEFQRSVRLSSKGVFFTGNQLLQNHDYDVTKSWFYGVQ